MIGDDFLGKNRNNFFNNVITYEILYNDYFRRIKEIVVNLYKWKNVPDKIDTIFMEKLLFSKGQVAFFKDEIIDKYLMCTYVNDSTLDFYGNVRSITIQNQFTGYINTGLQDFEIIYNNALRTPTCLTVDIFARKMAEIDLRIMSNVRLQNSSKIICSTEQQRITFENFFLKWMGNTPLILADKNLDMDGIQTADLTPPIVFDKMQIEKNNIWNELLTYLGIENANSDKRDRLVSNEVNSNYGNVEMSRNSMFNERVRAVERINEHYGLNIEVEFNSNLSTMLNDSFSNVSRETLISEKEVKEDG